MSYTEGQSTGALSWAFRNAIMRNPQQSYIMLLNSIRSERTFHLSVM